MSQEKKKKKKTIVGIKTDGTVVKTDEEGLEHLANGKCPFCTLSSGWKPSTIKTYTRRRHRDEVWLDVIGRWCVKCETFFPKEFFNE